jgi:hypothetical protein
MEPDNFNSLSENDWMEKWHRELNKRPMAIYDPEPPSINNLPHITTLPGNTTNGIWSQITSSSDALTSMEQRMEEMQKQMEIVQLENKLMKLRMLGIEGKFSQEEVTNIRKMMISEDEAARTLANSIIENA